MKSLSSFLSVIFLQLEIALAQFSISDILAGHSEISEFATIINSSTTFSQMWFSQLTDYTLLAPNNDAIAAWRAMNSSSNETDDVMLYHLLFGRYPSANITNSPVPIRTWLTDIAKTNISDGQRVMAYSNSSGLFFESGSKTTSKVVNRVRRRSTIIDLLLISVPRTLLGMVLLFTSVQIPPLSLINSLQQLTSFKK
jgi:hypothetical protein